MKMLLTKLQIWSLMYIIVGFGQRAKLSFYKEPTDVKLDLTNEKHKICVSFGVYNIHIEKKKL